jgi:hypothetical protein
LIELIVSVGFFLPTIENTWFGFTANSGGTLLFSVPTSCG